MSRVYEETIAPLLTAIRMQEVVGGGWTTTERRYEPSGIGGRKCSVAWVMKREGEAEETSG